MAATYPAMQTMYYQQPPMQMMTIAPTMPQMAIQQPLPPVTMAIAQKQVAVAPKPGVIQPAGHQQMSLTMSASAPLQVATQQQPPQAQPARVLPGHAQLGTRPPAPHTGQPPPRQLTPYPNVQPVLRAPLRTSHSQPDQAQPNQVQGHPVPPSPLNNRPPFPNRSSPLPNHPPPSFAPPQPGNQMGGAASISGIANGKQNIQRFSPY